MGIISTAKEIVDVIISWKRTHKPTAKDLIAHRIRMREEIERNLHHFTNSSKEVIGYEDIIIRNVRRMDEFPELDEHEVGMSPWLKLDVSGFYHRGIEVFLITGGGKAVPVADTGGYPHKWRFINEGEDAESAIYALAVGRIPFDFIESIDWSRSDGYFHAPHFYCRFDGPLREPYEEIIYKGILYPQVSKHHHELRGLKRDADNWGFFKRRTFLLRQDVLRCYRWLKKS